jgi:hypothetical protein
MTNFVQWPKSTTRRCISVRGRNLITFINQGLRAIRVGTPIAQTSLGGFLQEEQHRFGQEA